MITTIPMSTATLSPSTAACWSSRRTRSCGGDGRYSLGIGTLESMRLSRCLADPHSHSHYIRIVSMSEHDQFARLPFSLLGLILIEAGFCKTTQHSALGICRSFRDCVLEPITLVQALVAAHGTYEAALMRAVQCTRKRIDQLALIQELLKTVQADCQDGRALTLAVDRGQLSTARLLLECKEHAPRADCQGGEALMLAVDRGHVAMVRLLLDRKWHAPRADVQDGRALLIAAECGHVSVVRMLLDWKEHAPRADCQNGCALLLAAQHGHEAVVQLLLEWKEHAPRADCQNGRALLVAAEHGQEAVVRMLLERKELVPRAVGLWPERGT